MNSLRTVRSLSTCPRIGGEQVLREQIQAQIIPFKEVYNNLKAVGAPYRSELICVTREHLILTFDYIPYMRSRFTGVAAIFRLGILPQLKEYLFGEKF